MLTAVHPDVAAGDVVEATGWELSIADDVTETDPPTRDELTALRALESRGGGAWR